MSLDTLDFIIRSAVSWLFRVKRPESWIFRGAVLILLMLHGPDWFIKYSGTVTGEHVSVEIGGNGGGSSGALFFLDAVCVLLMISALVWAWIRYKNEQDRLSRKKVLVIEGRGLRDDDGSPLVAAIPENIQGSRDDYLLDLRQRKDGVIVEPVDLLPHINTMKSWHHQAQKGKNREDLTTVYGGLTAVPLTFLTGLQLDDEGDVIVMDWDRIESRWRMLEELDDGLRFDVAGIEELNDEKEVVLAISASYLVKSDDLASSFTYPIVRMTLPDLQSSHWSQSKQSVLADQFLGVLKQLDAKGVACVHLVLAAQNSVVFNLARRYDKRNLPGLIVYQFERGQDKRYPWGIEMPVAGVESAKVRHILEAECIPD